MASDRDVYRYSLAITSQFPFCGIPLRLDTYSACQFSCAYCFASARGGNVPSRKLQVADDVSFASRLERVRRGVISSAVDEMLAARIPIHMGGMTDPFPPVERTYRASEAHLKAAAAHDYPLILSTKSSLVAEDRVLRILRRGRFAVQISLSMLSDSLGRLLDLGAPLPTRRLRIIRTLYEAGVAVACRIQPALPGRDSEIEELIVACAEAGASHVAVEHLKVPIEKNWRHKGRLNEALGFDVTSNYLAQGSVRVGREWVLPVAVRLPKILRYRAVARSLGLSFGAADTDLLHLSDGSVCCSGADILGLGSGFQFNYLEAIRRRSEDGLITMGSLSDVWAPERSIRQFVNSHSRDCDSSVRDFIRRNWARGTNGSALGQFFGVERQQETPDLGVTFRLTDEAQRLIGSK